MSVTIDEGNRFSERELAYIESQRLARLATVSGEGQPDVVAVGFEFDGQEIYIGGRNHTASRKSKNVESGNTQVALILDDLVSIDPWRPRGIRIYGLAENVERRGMFGPAVYLRIKPTVSWSWSLEDGPVFVDGKFAPHKTVHSQS